MKSVIIYASRHQGNTEKLVKSLAERFEIDLINGETVFQVDWDKYDLIGFASGMDFGKFYPSVTALAEQLPAGKKLYSIHTCARDNEKYGSQIREIARRRDCVYLGRFACKGYNTYGPWKLIGGMNKGHPNGEDMERLAVFYEELLASLGA